MIAAWTVALLVATATPAAETAEAPTRPGYSPQASTSVWTEEDVALRGLGKRLAASLLTAASSGVDDVAILEAEEIGAVAEELFVEGEFDIAASLYEEALALLTPQTPPDSER